MELIKRVVGSWMVTLAAVAVESPGTARTLPSDRDARWSVARLTRILSILAALSVVVMGQQPSDRFTTAKRQDPPERQYDLKHISLHLRADYDNRRFFAYVENTLALLKGGLNSITISCGANLRVKSCAVSGQAAKCDHQGDSLIVNLPKSPVAGQNVRVDVSYEGDSNSTGFHWIEPDASNGQRVGFFTLGATSGHPSWLPTWNYPSDFATSETWVTVPATWYVVGNGELKSNRIDSGGKTRTFHWQMDQPHATYLISLAAGPFDIQRTVWRGVPLMYVVPKGSGHKIPGTFGKTPELLTFYSDLFRMKYPWPKYAQTVLYDFSTNVEWISATSFQESLLSDGSRNSLPIIAHELVHQWFGDLVSCKHWGDLWLNEGFALYFGQMLYSEHWQGNNAYDHGVEVAMRAYFQESRRYERPLSTHFYPDPGSLFDAHTYSKGALILHMLRRRLGDEAFFRGIHHYLAKYQHTPVDTNDFRVAMSESTGIDLSSFFDQWVYAAGHPVLDYSWEWDDKAHKIILQVRQLQDLKNGGRRYQLTANVGLIIDGKIESKKVDIAGESDSFSIAAPRKPDAVLLDPDHDFVREIPTLHWSANELPYILAFATNADDRETAMNEMLEGNPSAIAVQQVVKAIRQDRGAFPALRSIRPLAVLRREELRAFFREQLSNPARRNGAVYALALLPKNQQDIQSLRALVNADERLDTIATVISGLADWDAPGNRDVFAKALQLPGGEPDSFLRLEAYAAIAKADLEEGKYHEPDTQTAAVVRQFLTDASAGNKDSSAMTPQMHDYVQPHRADVADWLKNQTSFLYLMRADVANARMRRREADIAYIAYFRIVTSRSRVYLKLFITQEGRVADWRVTLI